MRYSKLGLLTVCFIFILVHSGFTQKSIATGNWPQFRGVQASGVANAPDLPTEWDAATGYNIKWKIPVQGLGLSSPVIWGDKLFITTAVGEGHEDDRPYLRVGLYGESPEHPEDYPHFYQVICVDKNTGKEFWKKTAIKAVPQVKRHIKASHANSSVGTDGRYVVAFFGSQGLYCYDMNGNLKWKKDLGYLDAGAFDAPEIQWGFGSSPVIHKNKVIVQCDVNNQSFVAMYDVKTGNEIWRKDREEVPSWGTPTVVQVNGRDQIVVNGWHHRGAYDFETGEPIWWMDGGGDIPTPTPIIAHDMAFFSSAHGRLRPIYAIKLAAKGDITLQRNETSNEYVAWSYPRRGAYMPTPILVGDNLYVGDDRGILTCYDAKTGAEKYRERVGGKRGAYTASPVSNKKYIYFVEEFGNIHVHKAGNAYEHVASNAMGTPILASPAISGKTMFIRTAEHLYAVEDLGKEKPATLSSKKEVEVEPIAYPPKKEVTIPDGELDDARAIMKIVDAVSQNVESVQYDAEVFRVMGEQKMSLGKATVIGKGTSGGFAARYRADAEFTAPGMTEPMRISGGTDGDKWFLINHQDKTVGSDFGTGFMGQMAQPLFGAAVAEFFVENPFTAEAEAFTAELQGTESIGGEVCYKIYIKYDEERPETSTWYISKKDFLPRSRFSPRQDGSAIQYILTNIKPDPKLAADAFKFKTPEGYTEQ